MTEIRSFEDLEVWKRAIDVADLTHELTEKFPKQIQWGLGVQMQRAAVSIGSNIAEGCERQHTPEYIQFCYIALGSCAELYTQAIIAKRRGYIERETAEKLLLMINEVRRKTRNLAKALKVRKNG